MNVRQDFCGQLELNLLMGLFLKLVFFFLMGHENVCMWEVGFAWYWRRLESPLDY